jgi:hypothetical protein
MNDGIVIAIGYFCGKGNCVRPVTLSLEPRYARLQLVKTPQDNAQIGPCHRLIQPNEHVALSNAHTLADIDLADDAA